MRLNQFFLERNPWVTGAPSPSPQDNKVLKARAIDAGEFDLELSDLTKRFKKHLRWGSSNWHLAEANRSALYLLELGTVSAWWHQSVP